MVTMITTLTSGLVIEYCEAGRYRAAGEMLESVPLDTPDGLLAHGMVETARGNQEKAKDYLSEALRLTDGPLANQIRTQLALAYWRAGEKPEAKTVLESVPEDFESLLTKAIWAESPCEALELLDQAAEYRTAIGMEGRLHNQRAIVLRQLGELDRAFVEYGAAIYCFEQAESDCLPIIENNLAGAYMDAGMLDEAHSWVDQAIKSFDHEPAHLAKAYDQKARIYLKQNNRGEAARFASKSVELLEAGDMKEWLIESLLTLSQANNSGEVLDRAQGISEYLNRGDLLLEVLLAKRDLSLRTYEQYDRESIELALKLCDGSLRQAAKKIGLNSHQVLTKRITKYGIARKPQRLKSLIK